MTRQGLKEAQSELKERSAALNTQLRFGRERSALLHAYQLRAYLQLRGAKLEVEQRELQRVEKVIAELETRKASGIQRLIKSIIEMAKAALNPEVDDESTLLDQFKATPATESDLDLGDLPELGSPAHEPGGLATTHTPPKSAALPEGEDGWGGVSGLSATNTSGAREPARVEEPPADGWASGLASGSSGGSKAPQTQTEDGWGPSSAGLTASSSGGFPRPKPDAGSSGGWGSPSGWDATESTAAGAWGGGESWTVDPPKKTSPAESAEPPEEDHWGGSGGYSYDDKF